MKPVDFSSFRYTSFTQEVIFGAGSLSRLSEAVTRSGWRRLMLCTSRSQRASGHAGSVEAALGDRVNVVFDRVQPHVQDYQVSEAFALASNHQVDAVIGLGGGSAIGLAKALAWAIEEKQTGNPLSPVIAIPTTYAGSEMTAMFGVTQHETAANSPRKMTVHHPKITPKLVLYDPVLTLDLPPEMTASTGMNAMAHCIEALYSVNRNPISTAAAVSGIRAISPALLSCHRQGNNLDARTDMLLGAHLAGFSISSVTLGLHHGLCHVLGGAANVPHGIANSIILPHAIRFNKDATANLLLPAAEAMGLPITGRDPAEAVEALACAISDLSEQMGLPQRLREAGVKESDLANLAQLSFQNKTVQNNPRPIQDAAQLEAILGEAW